ncbi:MAG: TAXI family TRAP transporter solute-binding subunit [Cocleimonas sp.]|nr:TAXI family TRAP transporter solute-binding subunit [Cocleimonas sp.]
MKSFFDAFKFYIIFALIFSIGLGVLWFYQNLNKTYHVRIAASKPGSETYRLVKAAADVTAKQYPSMSFELVPSVGSSQNLKLMKANQVQMAAVQADSSLIPEARLVSQLFPDIFQLVVRKDSNIVSVSDLRGKTLALPSTSSGQYKSFWFLMKHYNYGEGDFDFKSMSSSAAAFALEQGTVDAVFRVRPPGSKDIQALVEKVDVRILEIDQAGALGLSLAAISIGVIPKGSYQGVPPVPTRDIQSASVQRLLIARDDLDAEVVNNFTRVLFEQRKELLESSTLASFVQAPDRGKGTDIPLHEGAEQYYDRNEPNFLQEQAEPMAFIITILAVLGSGIMQLARRRQKSLLVAYNEELSDILKKAEHITNQSELQVMADHLNDIFKKIAKDRTRGKLTAEDFDFISFSWQMARDEVNERLIPQEIMAANTAGVS